MTAIPDWQDYAARNARELVEAAIADDQDRRIQRLALLDLDELRDITTLLAHTVADFQRQIFELYGVRPKINLDGHMVDPNPQEP